MNYVNSPEEFNPVLMGILAVLAWGALFISLRRSAVRELKAERLELARVSQERENFLRKPQI